MTTTTTQSDYLFRRFYQRSPTKCLWEVDTCQCSREWPKAGQKGAGKYSQSLLGGSRSTLEGDVD